MCKLGKNNKKTKTIIIEDGVVNPNEMCIITVPRNKENVVLYAKKREMAGPNVDKPKPLNTFNAMDELLIDRSGRAFDGPKKSNKVVSRAERYDNFRRALEKNTKRTERMAKINSTISRAPDTTPSRYDRNLSRLNKNASLSFMPQGSSTFNQPRFDESHFAPPLSSTINSSRAEGHFGPSSLRTENMASPSREDDFEDHQTFQPDYSNYPQTVASAPPWQFHSNSTYNPAKTFTIMPPDNRHFQQSKSSDFDACPTLAPPHYSYEDDYSDAIELGSMCDGRYEGSCCSSKPPDNQNYYSLIEESQNNSGNSSFRNRDSRSRKSNSFTKEHELVNIYNE